MKKCLLCKEKFEDNNLLKEYYCYRHNVDVDNYFFKQLFIKSRCIFSPMKFMRCGRLLE